MNLDIASATIPVFKKALIKGAILREPVPTNRQYRGLGKTTALIEFAKEHFLTVIVHSDTIAKSLINIHGYTKIVSIDSLYYSGYKLGEKYVFDEQVNEGKLYSFVPKNSVVTGYIMRGEY